MSPLHLLLFVPCISCMIHYFSYRLMQFIHYSCVVNFKSSSSKTAGSYGHALFLPITKLTCFITIIQHVGVSKFVYNVIALFRYFYFFWNGFMLRFIITADAISALFFSLLLLPINGNGRIFLSCNAWSLLNSTVILVSLQGHLVHHNDH